MSLFCLCARVSWVCLSSQFSRRKSAKECQFHNEKRQVEWRVDKCSPIDWNDWKSALSAFCLPPTRQLTVISQVRFHSQRRGFAYFVSSSYSSSFLLLLLLFCACHVDFQLDAFGEAGRKMIIPFLDVKECKMSWMKDYSQGNLVSNYLSNPNQKGNQKQQKKKK